MVDVEGLSDSNGGCEHREVEVGFSEVIGWGDDDGDGLDGVEGMGSHPVGLWRQEENHIRRGRGRGREEGERRERENGQLSLARCSMLEGSEERRRTVERRDTSVEVLVEQALYRFCKRSDETKERSQNALNRGDFLVKTSLAATHLQGRSSRHQREAYDVEQTVVNAQRSSASSSKEKSKSNESEIRTHHENSEEHRQPVLVDLHLSRSTLSPEEVALRSESRDVVGTAKDERKSRKFRLVERREDQTGRAKETHQCNHETISIS